MPTEDRAGAVRELQALLCGEISGNRSAFAGTVRNWFDNCLVGPGAALWRRLLDRPVPPGEATGWPDEGERWGGRPGEIWAAQGFERVPANDFGPYPFTADRWAAVRAELGAVPSLAQLSIFELRQLETLVLPGSPSIDIQGMARFADDDQPWFLLQAKIADGTADVDLQLAATMRAAADVLNPAYGEIAPDQHRFNKTAREVALNSRLAVNSARTQARGYCWLTILGENLGDRLGGLAALRASGAFAEVERLAAGGYWLLATERFADYDPAAADRVFATLRPVLDPTLPMAPSPYDDPKLLAPAEGHR